LKTVFDITLPITPELPLWPGTPGLEVTQVAQLEVDGYSETRICIGSHVGTHVDAPSHFLDSETTVDKLPLQILIGETLVVDLRGELSITAEILERLALPSGLERLLLKTDNSKLWVAGNRDFYKDYVALTLDGAEWLVDRGIRLVGIDYLSIQRFNDSNKTHSILLAANIIIIEGLNLTRVPVGFYELICLPLPIAGAEGAPARVLLRQ